jgi:hypothetical protein
MLYISLDAWERVVIGTLILLCSLIVLTIIVFGWAWSLIRPTLPDRHKP